MHQRSLAQHKPEGLAPRAVIDAGLSILGCLQTDGEVHIDGQISGDIRCAYLLVGKTGTIVGDISADEAVIRGRVKGAIQAGRVIIQESAHVESDISHDKLSIEEGAYFKGTSTPTKEFEKAGATYQLLAGAADDMKPQFSKDA